MGRKKDHIRKYVTQYRVVKRGDGNLYIQTLYPDRDGMTFDIYQHSDTHLAACLPPRAAGALMKCYPEMLRVHQIADDAIVLIFQDFELDLLAEPLKLRKRRKISVQQRRSQVERIREYQFHPQVRGGSRSENPRSSPRCISTPPQGRSTVSGQQSPSEDRGQKR